MQIVIIGNSAAGKSTLARGLEARHGLAHLDLDTIAWDPGAQRRPFDKSSQELKAFTTQHSRWVIDGCYADLAEVALARNAEDPEQSVELWWLDPGDDVCLGHAEARHWEPHKYPSAKAQDANLPMLREWIEQYGARQDSVSRVAHHALFSAYAGPKKRLGHASEALQHAVHPQLTADTHLLGELPSGSLLLHCNASLTWLILVPDVGPHDVRELLELDSARMASFLRDAKLLNDALRREGGWEKVNVASLGNQVPQLHVHLVGRRRDDACWPQPVWGNLPEGPTWSDEEIARLRGQLGRYVTELESSPPSP